MADQVGVWEYKGFTIKLQGTRAVFATTINGKHYTGSSLSATKKAIDKHLEEKANDVKINLPVVCLRSSTRFRDEGAKSIKKGVISGVDRETQVIVIEGMNDEDFRRTNWVLPDSKDSEDLLARYIAAEETLEALKKKIEARQVPTHLGGYGRNKGLYADAVKKLQDGYKAAQKGKSNE